MRYPPNLRLAPAGFGAIGIEGPLATVEDAAGETVARVERQETPIPVGRTSRIPSP